VDIRHEHHGPWWQYREAGDGEQGGVVINHSPTGHVEVRKNLVKAAVRENIASQLTTPRQPKEKSVQGPSFWRYIAIQRSIIIQAGLLQNPRKQREVAAALLLASMLPGSRFRLDVHPCIKTFSEVPLPKGYQVLAERVSQLLGKLGLERTEGVDRVWPMTNGHDAATIFTLVQGLSDDDLADLLALIPVLTFGQENIEQEEPKGSFFLEVFRALTINIREWWTPDEAFLSLLKREALEQVAIESGASLTMAHLNQYSKKELVAALASYFERVASTGDPDTKDSNGHTWLPKAMTVAETGSNDCTT
jgi:ParB family transcriptional regulator, chromosome partitioning protein